MGVARAARGAGPASRKKSNAINFSTISAIAPALKLEDPIEGQLRQWAELGYVVN